MHWTTQDRQRTEERGQRTEGEDRGQRREDRGRGQRTEERGQRTEDRGQRTEERGQRERTEDRGERTEGEDAGCTWSGGGSRVSLVAPPGGAAAVTSLPVPSGLEFRRWLSGSGPPLVEPDLSAADALTRPVQDLCDLWGAGKAPERQVLETFDLSAWSTFQIVLFLDRMLDMAPLPQGTGPGPSESLSLSLRGHDPPGLLLLLCVWRSELGGSDPLAAAGGEELVLPRAASSPGLPPETREDTRGGDEETSFL